MTLVSVPSLSHRTLTVLGILAVFIFLVTRLHPGSWVPESHRYGGSSSSSSKLPPSFSDHEHGHGPETSDARCDAFPDPGNIAVIVKTGATEIYEKLPTQVMTNLQCAKNLVLVSDLEMDIGPYHVHDVLDRFTPELVENNPDFKIYREIQRYGREGLDFEELNDMPDENENWRTAGHNAAWALDKYKFLHMLERAWALQPFKDWYVFLETDTYLAWGNTLRWLEHLDPTEPVYLGLPTPMYETGDPEFYFAHGGSGYVISGTAMHDFCVEKEGAANRWDERISKMWFGDYVLAAALKEEVGLLLNDTAPMRTGDRPRTTPFSTNFWCQPVFALHHSRPEEVSAVWRFEQEVHHQETPLLFSHIYDYFIANQNPIPEEPRDDWDNLSNDRTYLVEHATSPPPWQPPKEDDDEDLAEFKNVTETFPSSEGSEEKIKDGYESIAKRSFLNEEPEDPNASFSACQSACESDTRCLQYSYEWVNTTFIASEASNLLAPEDLDHGYRVAHSVCHLSSAFRLGTPRAPENETMNEEESESFGYGSVKQRMWKAGWMKMRIDAWVKEHVCEEDAGRIQWTGNS